MSAVICSDVNTSCLELKSAALTLMALVLKTTDLAQLAAELSRRASAMPGLFDDEPVVVDLSFVRATDAPIDFDVLVVLLMQHGMRPVAVRGGAAEQMAAALASGLLEAPEGARPALREVPANEVVERIVEKIVEVQLPAPPPLAPLVIDKPLRSGQQVHAQGRDLIVLALVSFGAEVSADGDIHIYAPLRGRAHAGKSGNTEARIYCHCMQAQAQVLAIAGVLRTTDVALPDGIVGQAAMVRWSGEQLIVERLG